MKNKLRKSIPMIKYLQKETIKKTNKQTKNNQTIKKT